MRIETVTSEYQAVATSASSTENSLRDDPT